MRLSVIFGIDNIAVVNVVGNTNFSDMKIYTHSEATSAHYSKWFYCITFGSCKAELHVVYIIYLKNV